MYMALRICIVEDDESIQDVLRIILQRAGYETTVHGSGLPIMEHTYPIPDVFLIDKQLPGVDGLTLCKHLKDEEETKAIPVIMMSAYPNLADLSALAGADAFIEKPFRIDALLGTINKHVPQPIPVGVSDT
jgi:CheY-like chemotaxis protein